MAGYREYRGYRGDRGNIFAAPSFPGQHANCNACQDLVMISINYSPAGVGWPGSATETQRARIAIFATKTIG